MKNRKRAYEENSVLALLYDEYKRRYSETIESIQREIEALYEELHGSHLLNAEEVTAVVVAMGEDRCRYAHEDGVRVGVRLAMDLELETSLMGGCSCVCDC